MSKKFSGAPYPWRIACMVLAIMLLSGLITPPVHAATRYEIGISTSSSLLWMDSAAQHARLLTIKKSGASWIRIDFSWAAIQPRPDRYMWEPYDRVVQAAAAHNIKILAVLIYTPPWARMPECRSLIPDDNEAKKCAPRNAAEFASFAGTVAARYSRHTMRGWEIWNEPNLNGYWKSVHRNRVLVDPRAYARLANAAARQIKPHNPDAVILTGGLAPMFEPSLSKGMRQSEYLAQLLPHLEAGLFSGIAVHPYSWPVLPTKAAPYNAFYTVDKSKDALNLRVVMKKSGWRDKEIWATEYGASTKGLRSVNDLKRNERLDHVNEAAQARILQEGIRHWYKKSNAGPMFVHSDSDQWLAQRRNEGGFGLKRSDGTPKPAYDIFRREAQKLKKSRKDKDAVRAGRLYQSRS